MQTDQFRPTAVLVRLRKKPRHLKQVAGFWRRPTLARPIAVLPSGLQRFTAVFGMGTGGATALLSPECRTALAFRCFRSDASARPNLWGLRSVISFCKLVTRHISLITISKNTLV